MKKALMIAMAGILLATTVPSVQAGQERGGFMGFIAGCCFGVRAAGAYNDGKNIHWREWVMLVPVVNLVFAVWTGIEGSNGVTTADFAKRYGSMYY